jgi:hypothetical protein
MSECSVIVVMLARDVCVVKEERIDESRSRVWVADPEDWPFFAEMSRSAGAQQ